MPTQADLLPAILAVLRPKAIAPLVDGEVS